MDKKIPIACSLTHLFTDKPLTSGLKVLLNDFPEPLAPTTGDFKTAIQQLQLTILEGNPSNVRETGDCFQKFELYFDKLILKFKK
jgi:hypothetical protein